MVNRFRPRTVPDAPEVIGAIEAVLLCPALAAQQVNSRPRVVNRWVT